MAITRLKRKGRKNKLTSKLRLQKLALLSATPVIKNVDIEAIKVEFAAALVKPKTVNVEAAIDKPIAKTEKVAPQKKAAPKKEPKKKD